MKLIDGAPYQNPQSGARCRLFRNYTDSTWILREYAVTRGIQRITNIADTWKLRKWPISKDYEEDRSAMTKTIATTQLENEIYLATDEAYASASK